MFMFVVLMSEHGGDDVMMIMAMTMIGGDGNDDGDVLMCGDGGDDCDGDGENNGYRDVVDVWLMMSVMVMVTVMMMVVVMSGDDW